jgi:hypothetical protein
MINMVRRALERRRAIRETVDRLIEQLDAGAWKHARDRTFAAGTRDDLAFWRQVQARIEAHDDRTARASVRRKRARS